MARIKNKNLSFIPRAVSFESLPAWKEPCQEDAYDFIMEKNILQMIYSLDTDKDRCVFMLLLLREYGFNFDHESSAQSLHIEWRWYMRVKQRIEQKLKPFFRNAI